MLTIAYVTSRKQPCIDWFSASLARETARHPDLQFRVVIVDFWANHGTEPRRPFSKQGWTLTAPKPCVWQGPHRLTKADYFAQCNARNTALCLATDGWIAFVDDLSVLMPGWLGAVREAIAGNYIACGAYRKVNGMVVEDGVLKDFIDQPIGVDHRWQFGRDDRAVPCTGAWAYGCSLALPVEAALTVGGYPEALCDGMGYEDVAFGRMLETVGYTFRYDRRMLTYESDELHGQLPVMRREDPCRGDPNANPRDDQSHALLRAVAGLRHHPNYFGEGGIRGLRQRVLAGEPFPVVGIPEHRWFDAKPLRELPEDVPAEEPVEL